MKRFARPYADVMLEASREENIADRLAAELEIFVSYSYGRIPAYESALGAQFSYSLLSGLFSLR